MTTHFDAYTAPPPPENEVPRLKELNDLDILDMSKEERFDRYTELAADIFNIPVAIITLIDKDYQWFKSCFGASMTGTPRDLAFCAYTLLEDDVMVIPDMLKDERFINHPLVAGEPYVRFYAGILLRGPNNLAVGTLCLIGFEPQQFSDLNRKRLGHIGKMIEHELHYKHHLNQLRKHVENTIYYDTFTDLPTRRLFHERLQIALQEKKENSDRQTEIIVFCLGVPHLENIKITAGQNTVNLIIKEASWRLKKALGNTFNIAKGNENYFLIFGEASLEASGQTGLQKIITSILSIFDDTFNVGDHVYETILGKLGIAVHGTDELEGSELINKAIIAMNMILNSAENSRLYSSCPIVDISKNFLLENKLGKAIRDNHLHIEFQPIVNVQTGIICGAEVLCRWIDPEYGSISPGDFIPVAEESGLIIPLGEWVLNEALHAVKKWQGRNIINFPISVNLSSGQLLKEDFLTKMKKLFEDNGVEPHLINLEVTEASLIYNIDQAIENIKKANEIGITFSLDDFGTGFSSLKYLQKLPLKYLKIDKSFVENITTNANDSSLVQGIIALAKTLGLEVVAEGIETKEQLMYLKAYQCHRAQGYLFSRALRFDDFLNAVEQQQKE